MGRKVTQVAFGIPELQRDKNVAAYCRVSSGKDAMLHSPVSMRMRHGPGRRTPGRISCACWRTAGQGRLTWC